VPDDVHSRYDTPWGIPNRCAATRDQGQLIARLHRIAGQIGGIERMVDEERYCIDVLTQIHAVQAALDKVALGLLDDHSTPLRARRRPRRARCEDR